ncbi:unnamed protein product [Victoria cruziana]
MTSNGGGTGTRNGGAASISAAATAFASAETRFPPQPRRRRWRYFWSGFSCFRSQKGGKRVVPASRIPDSPSCFLSLSANMSSLDGPSSTMFTTGPYAHETQLVSPPVFSTFTTEPSTAPFTPPPELAHLTTPSSPDVPFARLLSSPLELKGERKEDGVNLPYETSGYVSASDLQAAYQLYPGSPASRLVSPKSGQSTAGLSSPYPEQEFPPQWSALISSQEMFLTKNKPSKLFGSITTSRNFSPCQESSFFCPAASAQFYLDQAQQPISSYPHCGGRLSLSKEADAYSNVGNTHHRHSKARKSDAEELEAYRVSFGFSADEIITAPHYVEPSDVIEDSFTIIPFATTVPYTRESAFSDVKMEGERTQVRKGPNSLDAEVSNSSLDQNEDAIKHTMQNTSGSAPCADAVSCGQIGDISLSGSSSDRTNVGQVPLKEDLDVDPGYKVVLSGPEGESKLRAAKLTKMEEKAWNNAVY